MYFRLQQLTCVSGVLSSINWQYFDNILFAGWLHKAAANIIINARVHKHRIKIQAHARACTTLPFHVSHNVITFPGVRSFNLSARSVEWVEWSMPPRVFNFLLLYFKDKSISMTVSQSTVYTCIYTSELHYWWIWPWVNVLSRLYVVSSIQP